MVRIRLPEEIFQAGGTIRNGTFRGRWHFSFGEYYDPAFVHFGTLRVLNDDTLSPGAVWPLHPHQDNEVVTYCADGEFRHADERGKGGVLKKGWVQHTTVGSGMWHSEINNLPDRPLRFIQLWFLPATPGLPPAVEQKAVERDERRGRFLPLVSNTAPSALRIVSAAEVLSSYLEKGQRVVMALREGWGAYLYVLEGGPAVVNGIAVPVLGAAMLRGEREVAVLAEGTAELLLVLAGPA